MIFHYIIILKLYTYIVSIFNCIIKREENPSFFLFLTVIWKMFVWERMEQLEAIPKRIRNHVSSHFKQCLPFQKGNKKKATSVVRAKRKNIVRSFSYLIPSFESEEKKWNKKKTKFHFALNNPHFSWLVSKHRLNEFHKFSIGTNVIELCFTFVAMIVQVYTLTLHHLYEQHVQSAWFLSSQVKANY